MKSRLLLFVTPWLLFCALCAGAVTPKHPEDVVRADLQALSRGDVAAVAALFSEDARMYGVPGDPRRLVGDLIPAMSGREAMRRSKRANPRVPDRYEIIDLTSIGALVIARQKVMLAPDYAKARYSLVAYRVGDGQIHDVWHIAQSDDAATLRNDAAVAVIWKFTTANNRGDVEAFLALFSPDARNYRRAEVPLSLADRPSDKIVDHASRGRVFRAMFAGGAPVQSEPIAVLVFGDLVIVREVTTRPDGQKQDGLSIYRVRDGLIHDDWFVASVAR